MYGDVNQRALFEVEPSDFERELTSLINKYSRENASGTPDYILSKYLINCLRAFDTAVIDRAIWRREGTGLPATERIHNDG